MSLICQSEAFPNLPKFILPISEYRQIKNIVKLMVFNSNQTSSDEMSWWNNKDLKIFKGRHLSFE